jgi:hypothetical protein
LLDATPTTAPSVRRQFHGHRRGAVGRAVDVDAAVHGADPFGQAEQAAAGDGGGAAPAVVGDADAEQAGDVHGLEGSVPGAAVLGHVGQQLGRRVVGDGLDGGRWALRDVGDQLDRQRAARGERGQRVAEAVVQHGGVDAPGQGAYVGDRLDGPAVRVVDQLGDTGQVDRRGAVELFLGQAQLHGQRHELGLGAVVQVPLDVAEPGRGVVHDARPALLEGADPLGGGTGAE